LSLSSPSTVPAGNLAKASSLGAKTVNVSVLNVSTSPAALAAAINVSKTPASIPVSTIFLILSTPKLYIFFII